jgi:hypothetical protein
MSENPFKKTPPETMEGRFIDKDGVDHGDRDFHERQMGTDDEQEQADLAALIAANEEKKKPTP